MDATRRGDDRRQEGVTQAVSRVALPILQPSPEPAREGGFYCPLIEREIKVLQSREVGDKLSREVSWFSKKTSRFHNVET